MTSFAAVATLVGAPDRISVSQFALDEASRVIGDISGQPPQLRQLDPGRAADLFFIDERHGTAIRNALVETLGPEPIDVIVQPTAFRRKKLLIADMDSTMIGQECIDELAGMAGLKERVAAVTERAMRGEIDFEPALRERVALLSGLEQTVIARVLAERITLTPGAIALVRTMRANGAHTALVSGGFTLFSQKIAEAIGFHEYHANTLLVEDGRLLGLVEEPILGRDAKLAALRELRMRHGLSKEETLAVGDGANDLPMLLEAGLGVAFHAKPAVAVAAQARIEYGDLTSLLYAQGYSRDEFQANKAK